MDLQIRSVPNGAINKQGFSNPHPWVNTAIYGRSHFYAHISVKISYIVVVFSLKADTLQATDSNAFSSEDMFLSWVKIHCCFTDTIDNKFAFI